MVRGFYSAGSGMITNSRKLSVCADNIAKATTPGYKKDDTVTTSFNENLITKIDKLSTQPLEQIGGISNGQTVESILTSHEQGALQKTDNPLDIAIAGDGFFTIRDVDNTLLYTRNGQFKIDEEGFTTDLKGGRLIGTKGPINTQGRLFTVSENGGVYVEGNHIDNLLIYNPINKDTMVKYREGMFSDMGQGQVPFTGSIQQGHLELSNVSMLDEMMKMMSSQRSFQSCGQLIKIIDESVAKAVKLGSLN